MRVPVAMVVPAVPTVVRVRPVMVMGVDPLAVAAVVVATEPLVSRCAGHQSKARLRGVRSLVPMSLALFAVRAVGAAGADPTPAKRGFRVVRTHK